MHQPPRLVRAVSTLRTLPSARSSGQIIVLFAVFVIVLMVLAGSAYDYASIVTDDARLQNAVDSAVLAGSNSLVSSSGQPAATAIVIAQATAQAYLAANGVATATPGTNVVMTFPTSTPVGANPSSAIIENMSLSVTRNHPNSFWPLVGINSVNLQGAGGAHAARSMLDVVLSLDTTGSLVTSHNLTDSYLGTYTTVQDAVTAFINALAPTSGDPRGPKIGIGRYAGVQCTFNGSSVPGESNIVHIYSASSPASEYVQPCTDDETVLTPLTNNSAALLQIAGGPSSGCPTSALYACPIQHKHFTLPSNPGLSINGSIQSSYNGVAPYFSGTKEPNALCLVIPADSLCLASHTPAALATQGFAWKAANGARNCVADGSSWPCPAGTGNNQARRVLIIMTDGQDEAWPTTLSGSQNPQTTPDYALPEAGSPLAVTTYDSNFKTLASHLKAVQADGSPGVEIYVVGFFCTNSPTSYSSGNYGTFCQSKIAYDPAATRACPGPSYTAGSTGSPIDDLLVNVSSSTGSSCDHYFAISKTTDSLTGLFQAMAGTISRGQLTQ
jgi:Flp pilus assembly protein TadG